MRRKLDWKEWSGFKEKKRDKKYRMDSKKISEFYGIVETDKCYEKKME